VPTADAEPLDQSTDEREQFCSEVDVISDAAELSPKEMFAIDDCCVGNNRKRRTNYSLERVAM